MMNCEMNHVASDGRNSRPQRSSARQLALTTAWVCFAPLTILVMFLLTQLR